MQKSINITSQQKDSKLGKRKNGALTFQVYQIEKQKVASQPDHYVHSPRDPYDQLQAGNIYQQTYSVSTQEKKTNKWVMIYQTT